MRNKRKIYEDLKQNPANVHFRDLCKYAEIFSFKFKGGKGSHRIYAREGIFELLNFQNVNGRAKSYQVKQFFKVIEKYRLDEDDFDGI